MSRARTFAVPAAHPALAGHFPGLPLVPGSVILDYAIAAWGGPCLGIPVAKFHAPLEPDCPAEVRFEPTADRAIVRFECRCEGRAICSGRIRIAPAA